MIKIGITGMGAISAAGPDVESLWKAARDGVSAVRPLDIPGTDTLRVRIAATVQKFDPKNHLSANELLRCDRFTQFSHLAADEAIQQASIMPEHLKGPRTAVIMGTGIGGIRTLDQAYSDYHEGIRRVNPLTIPRVMPSSAASHLSITHGITGPCFCVSSACSSASQSIGVGAQMIRSGLVDRAIVGGSEASITAATMKAWEMMRVLSPIASRPFSKDRKGMNLGEGAGALILESETAMKKRKAEPLAWLAGYGTSSDANDIIQPRVEGAALSMQAALNDAQLSAGDIGYINAHGTGTVLNDINEANAVHTVFDEHAETIPVSSTKPIIGHTLGASGALEFIVALCAMRENTVPPHINMTEVDPKCQLNLPGEKIESQPLLAVLSNSFAFGGVNASLIASAVN